MRLLLLRHGESHSNAEPRAAALPEPQGDRLTERGRLQAEAAARALRRLRRPAAALEPDAQGARDRRAARAASSGSRSRSTTASMSCASRRTGSISPPEEQKLRRWSSWMAEHAADPDYAPGDAESFNAVLARARDFKRRIEAGDPSQVVLAVTHGIFLRFLLIDTLLGPAVHGRRRRAAVAAADHELRAERARPRRAAASRRPRHRRLALRDLDAAPGRAARARIA